MSLIPVTVGIFHTIQNSFSLTMSITPCLGASFMLSVYLYSLCFKGN